MDVSPSPAGPLALEQAVAGRMAVTAREAHRSRGPNTGRAAGYMLGHVPWPCAGAACDGLGEVLGAGEGLAANAAADRATIVPMAARGASNSSALLRVISVSGSGNWSSRGEGTHRRL